MMKIDPLQKRSALILFIVTCVLLTTQVNLKAQYSLLVGDPRNSWELYRGNIEQANLSIEPRGLFMEYGLTLEFSSEGTPWNDVSDTLEVVMEFQLPEEAVVFDSWLWIEGEPVQAKILDKWTASLIYEGIVKRRRDPSILSKRSATRYELRVFPMAGNETRKVKICYLMPCKWNRQMVSAQLPTPILRASDIYPDFSVSLKTSEHWGKPEFLTSDNIQFTKLTDSSYELLIPASNLAHIMEIGFKPPMEDGLFFSKYQDGNEGIYQFAIFPSDLIDTIVGNKVAVLVDFDGSNTDYDIEAILDITRNEMLKTLSERDSFNLVFSNLSIKRYSEQWVAATGPNIEKAFDEMGQQIADYSNLGTLIADGLEFVMNAGGGGKIILLTNADQYTDIQVANELIGDIMSLMEEPVPMHISDYQSRNYYGYWYNNTRYYGNEYLYRNLAKQTAGSHQRYREVQSMNETIALALKYSGGSIYVFDLHTSMENGFCHSRYMIQGNKNRAYIHDALLQVGKFTGTFPMELELSGAYNDQIFNKQFFVSENQAIVDDTLSEEIWTGQFIRELESEDPGNDVISEIIYYSIQERVLSRYTSFLCLEKNFQYEPGDIPENTDDPFIPIDVEDILVESDTLKLYPNPFSDYLTIELECADPSTVQELALYDLAGSLVYRFDKARPLTAGNNLISWNGTSAEGRVLDAGIYLLVYHSQNSRKTIKVVKL